MEYIQKRLKSMKPNEKWEYGNGFAVLRTLSGWAIYKSNLHQDNYREIDEVSKQIKLTFIAIEVTQKVFEE